MKSNPSILVFHFIIMGFWVILNTGCNKDKDDNKDPVSISITTVQIPAGTFSMGSPLGAYEGNDDETQHQVTLSAFRMSKYEITNTQYAAFLNNLNIGSNGLYEGGNYPHQPLINESSDDEDWGLHFTSGQWVPVEGYENNPVIEVTWEGATEFAKYVSGRLPTEAEWEYACRANTSTPFNTGACISNVQANYDWGFPYSNCTNTITTFPCKTQPVGTYPANSYGIFDMHGNVWELCSDLYGKYPSFAITNPTGSATGYGHVMRGGSCLTSAGSCRSTTRRFYPFHYTVTCIGFRVVLVP